ncbi:MAG TPA: ATP-binding protein, partial [Porticoccaceae bacterium]|nr:ATP-binding protein [Porticoccaceae bacterium]
THRLRLRCPPGLVAQGDNRELHSAFANLIVNAIRHNTQGCDVLIHARAMGGNLVVRVRDNGVGIDARHLPRLTERFYRADDSRATSSGGTGLGLAIVKHVLGRHGASLRIRSTLGKGSVFSCRFAAPAAPEGSRAA